MIDGKGDVGTVDGAIIAVEFVTVIGVTFEVFGTMVVGIIGVET